MGIFDQADRAAALLQNLLSTFAALLFLPTGVYQIHFIVNYSEQYIFQVDWFYFEPLCIPISISQHYICLGITVLLT